jgi:CRISPR-associated protein Csm1
MTEVDFLLIGGDISGIQDFIYSVTSEKALKGLRGRSFYLQLISETIARKILDEFNLPMTNLLYTGGGHFYLLLPYKKNIEERLTEIKIEIDKNLLLSHNGKLAIILGWKDISYKDFVDKTRGFVNVWSSLGLELARKKRQKFLEIFTHPEDVKNVLGPFELGGEKKACEICGEEIGKGTQCDLCESFASLSTKLAKAKAIKIVKMKPHPITTKPQHCLNVLESFGYRYTFTNKEDKDAIVLNSTDFVGKFAGYNFIAHTTPMKSESEVMTLEDISEKAKGIKRWGIIRADVDDLGRIFAEGLGEDKTISRVSMLSYMLSLFFSARIDVIASKYRNKICVVYSGGDDLFILGAWSELPDISKRIYEDFRRFTCQSLTLCGGIYLAPSPKFPVYQAAYGAGKAVEIAKKGGKDRVTLFEQSIPWGKMDDISYVKDLIRGLLEDYGKKSIPRSLISTLYAGWQEKELVKKREIPMPRIWRLFYSFKKLMRGYKESDEQLEKLNELLKKTVTQFDLMPYLDVSIRWADYLTRKEEGRYEF